MKFTLIWFFPFHNTSFQHINGEDSNWKVHFKDTTSKETVFLLQTEIRSKVGRKENRINDDLARSIADVNLHQSAAGTTKNL